MIGCADREHISIRGEDDIEERAVFGTFEGSNPGVGVVIGHFCRSGYHPIFGNDSVGCHGRYYCLSGLGIRRSCSCFTSSQQDRQNNENRKLIHLYVSLWTKRNDLVRLPKGGIPGEFLIVAEVVVGDTVGEQRHHIATDAEHLRHPKFAIKTF